MGNIMNRNNAAFLLPFAAMLCLSGAACAKSDAVIAQTTFDSDLGGWTTNTTPDVAWSAKGGNPGGEALFTDITSGVGTVLLAPTTFLSPAVNYAKLDGKAYISYQHLMVKETDILAVGNYSLTLSGPGGAATFTGAQAIVLDKKNQWTTIAVPLLQADWTITSGTWSALLANVTSLQVPMELVSNGSSNEDQEAVDNIMIVSHPAGFSIK
jgi:hypothetical protein